MMAAAHDSVLVLACKLPAVRVLQVSQYIECVLAIYIECAFYWQRVTTCCLPLAWPLRHQATP
jgi:hypothetical protein